MNIDKERVCVYVMVELGGDRQLGSDEGRR